MSALEDPAMSRSLLSALVASLALSMFACAATTEDAADGAASEDALTGAQLPGVAAIEVATGAANAPVTTIAATPKVKALMASIKRLTPSAPRRACSLNFPSTRLVFRDGAGKKIGDGSFACGMGAVHVVEGNKDIQIIVQDPGFSSVVSAPLVPADLLFGVDAIEIEKPMVMNSKRTLSDDAEVQALLESMDLDTLSAAPPETRCVPSHVVRFTRDGKQVGSASFTCSSGAPMPKSLVSRFSAPNPAAPNDASKAISGGLKLDPAEVEAAWKGAPAARGN
jgi:hypothetical protein